MSITNYTELVAAVTGWMNRATLASKAPDFIVLAESRIAKRMRLARQITTATLSTVANSQNIALPTDWLEFARGGVLPVGWPPMEYKPPDDFFARAADKTTQASVYTVEGGYLKVWPTPSIVYSIAIRYFARMPAIASANTNWLLTNHPDVYLFGALVEGYRYVREWDEAGKWEEAFQLACTSTEGEDARGKYSGSTLRVNTRPSR